MHYDTYAQEAATLLKKLIAQPSYSKEEDKTAGIIEQYLIEQGHDTHRLLNNIWVCGKHFNSAKPTLLLNSHHDTVKPVSSYTRDPFSADIEKGKLYGLGSNDAGASLSCLLQLFLLLQGEDQPYNVIFAATAEEEISGHNGIAALLPQLPPIDLAIVGEPTEMQMAVAEKGLMVIDAECRGASGHAARDEGINAIYLAMQDIEWLKGYKFPYKSQTLGDIRISVTQIQAGTQHNVVPDVCTFVIDVRTHERYTNQQVFDVLQQNTLSDLNARSFRLNASGISQQHALVKRGESLGLSSYGSPTLSDQALMQGFPSLKIGPGKSERSHTADEFILLSEIEEGIGIYHRLLEGLRF